MNTRKSLRARFAWVAPVFSAWKISFGSSKDGELYSEVLGGRQERSFGSALDGFLERLGREKAHRQECLCYLRSGKITSIRGWIWDGSSWGDGARLGCSC